MEGLEEYVGSYADLTEEFLTYAKQEAEDVINAYIARDYSDSSSVTPIEYAGYIFQYVKPGEKRRLLLQRSLYHLPGHGFQQRGRIP